jgi:putative transposase
VGDAQILASIKEIKQRHPFWGYRRVRAWLKYREGLPVGYKRIYRLMKEHELLVPQTPSGAATPGLGYRYDQVPHPCIGLGLLDGRVGLVQPEGGGLAVVRAVPHPRVREAMEDTVLQEFPNGVCGQGLKLISDNGCQPSSRSFLKVTATLDIE